MGDATDFCNVGIPSGMDDLVPRSYDNTGGEMSHEPEDFIPVKERHFQCEKYGHDWNSHIDPICITCGAVKITSRHPDAVRFVTAGLKYDQGKPPMELLSRQWLEGTAQVLAFGAKKYSAENWRNGIHTKRLIGAALRHTLAFLDGEDTDPETGLSHVHHASCCLMFISETMARRPEFDDRYKKKPSTP